MERDDPRARWADQLELVTMWWASLEAPGMAQVSELKRRQADGWRRLRCTILNLMHQPEWEQVLIGTEDLGPADPPQGREVRDGLDTARSNRPAWILQELSELGVVLRTDGDVEEIFGRPASELVGRVVLDFIHPDDRALGLEAWSSLLSEPGGLRTVEERVLLPDGRARWIEASLINRLESDGSGSITSLCHDISERRAEERLLHDRATTDALTGVLNRASLLAELSALGQQHQLTVAFIDLDGFKSVNDSLGHAAGDHVLSVMAGRLDRLASRGVTVGRWGGDEFVAFGSTVTTSELATLIDAALAEPIAVGEFSWRPSASCGFVLGARGEAADELIGRADAAMYEAKLVG